MSQFIESLKRLYDVGKVDNNTIIKLFNYGKITNEEKDYILS